jgi:hypothetical protein
MLGKLIDIITKYMYPSITDAVPPINTTELIDSDDNVVITETEQPQDQFMTLRDFIEKHGKKVELAQCETKTNA